MTEREAEVERVAKIIHLGWCDYAKRNPGRPTLKGAAYAYGEKWDKLSEESKAAYRCCARRFIKDRDKPSGAA